MKEDKYKWIELLAILATGLLKFILMDWLNLRAFYIAGVCVFWLWYVFFRYSSDDSVFKYWGFDKKNFKYSFIALLPLLIVSILFSIVYGIYNGRTIFTWRILPVLGLYPVWGTFQQFLMVGLTAQNLSKINFLNSNKSCIVLFTSAIFCLVHFPSFSLMTFTFCMETIFVLIYLKWKNLWSLGIVHGLIASFIFYYVAGRDLWSELFIWF